MLIRVFHRLREYFFPTLKEPVEGLSVVSDSAIAPAENFPTIESQPVEAKPDKKATLNAYVGDITKYQGDAIVNAANSQLMAGGGVCGAIFRAAGHAELQDACDEVGPCPTGQARTTPGFNLPAKYVIHAVGPIFEDGQDNEALLAGAYRSSLEEAVRVGAKTIAFPAISTGIYGYPLEEATAIAVRTVTEFCKNSKDIEQVDFTCFSPEILDVYLRELAGKAPTVTNNFDM